MERYFIRSVKYLVWLSVLFALILGIMVLTGTYSGEEQVESIFMSRRGWTMIAVIIMLAAIYPKIGFVKRRIPGDLVSGRGAVMKAMDLSGFVLEEEKDGMMIFKATGTKRLFLMFEDTVKIYDQDGTIILDGIRKEVVKIEYRLRAFIASPGEE